MISTELSLDFHDGAQPPTAGSSTVSVSDIESIFEIEIMMRQLFSEHKVEMKYTIESIITLQLQQLNHAITQERIERIEAILEMQTQISDLRAAFKAFSTNPPSVGREERKDEIII